jgi:hypothetical protein
LLGQPRPVLRGYPPETVVAEKTHALVRLGTLNSRMKDFYDLWLITRLFDFDGQALSGALTSTLAHRETPVPTEIPAALTDEFVSLKQEQWQAFLHTARVTEAPQDLGLVIEQVRAFLWPVLQALSQGQVLRETWSASGPWRAL